jgi:hypothetical protein
MQIASCRTAATDYRAVPQDLGAPEEEHPSHNPGRAQSQFAGYRTLLRRQYRAGALSLEGKLDP